MILISFGVPKSGSTLAFELAKRLLEDAGFRQRLLPNHAILPSAGVNFLRDWTAASTDALLAEVRDEEFIAVKTHGAPPPDIAERVRRGHGGRPLRVHMVFRDPREAALSLLDAGRRARAGGLASFREFHTLEQARDRIRSRIEFLGQWARVPGALPLLYDDLAFDTIAAIRRMADHLGVPCAPWRVRNHVLARAFIQFNKGVPGRHRELTPDQDAAFQAEFGDFIREVCGKRNFAWLAR